MSGLNSEERNDMRREGTWREKARQSIKQSKYCTNHWVKQSQSIAFVFSVFVLSIENLGFNRYEHSTTKARYSDGATIFKTGGTSMVGEAHAFVC